MSRTIVEKLCIADVDDGRIGGEERGCENTASKQSNSRYTDRLWADAVLQDAAYEAAQAKSEQHKGSDKVDCAVGPSKVGNGRLFTDTPEVENTDTKLNGKAADYSAEKLGTIGANHKFWILSLRIQAG